MISIFHFVISIHKKETPYNICIGLENENPCCVRHISPNVSIYTCYHCYTRMLAKKYIPGITKEWIPLESTMCQEIIRQLTLFDSKPVTTPDEYGNDK